MWIHFALEIHANREFDLPYVIAIINDQGKNTLATRTSGELVLTAVVSRMKTSTKSAAERWCCLRFTRDITRACGLASSGLLC